jgi:hypothetical protein
MAKWSAATTLGNASITDDGTIVSATLPFRAANGAVSAPSYAFTNGTSSGLYLDSGTTLTLTDHGTVALAFGGTGYVSAMGAITTDGIGLLPLIKRVRSVAQTSAIGTTTLVTTGASTADYLIVATLYCTTASAAATATITIGYTDTSNTAQTIIPSAAACTALGASSFALISSPFTAKNATNITYAVAIANTPTFDVRISLYQLGLN